MTGLPGTGWHVEQATPVGRASDGCTCAACAPALARRPGRSRHRAAGTRPCPSRGTCCTRARPRLVVAARARRRTRRGQGDARLEARRRAVVAAAAGVGIAGVQHRRPARRAEGGPVEGARARVDDAGVVHAVLECRRARAHPSLQRRQLGVRKQALMRARGERGQDGRSPGRRQGGRRGARRDAGDRPQERRGAPPAAGFVSPWQETQCAWRIGATSASKTGGCGAVARSSEHAVSRAGGTRSPGAIVAFTRGARSGRRGARCR